VLGVGVQTWGTDAGALRRYWALADDLGFARVTYGDGLGPWTLDGWTALGALAVGTRRARVGPAVTYAFDPAAHHPSWLAKRALTLDHLSGGRAELRLGVGAEDDGVRCAWARHGIAYPTAAVRVAMVEEAVGVIRALWRGERVDHPGPHWRLTGATLAPLPVQRPGPPVWIAAMGERALAATARCADGWEASYLAPAAFADRWALVRAHLAAAGRPVASLRRSVELDVALSTEAGGGGVVEAFCAARGIGADHPLLETILAGAAPAVAARIAEYAAAGVTDLTLGFADFPATAMLEAFARDVLPLLHRQGAAPPIDPPRSR
jgi:alkanesulfonate monooxygenase SsuD/methylene tetrahydromethanopterin reductase-like flavin-dependent oxidoreductase (luciferase family)